MGPKWVCVCALAVSVSGPTLAPGAPPGANLKSWIDGPIRYIASADEAKLFRVLDKDADRVLFIEKFWQRRDPTPDTLLNEYRQLFWQRVREANEKFIDGVGPGWRTDRGKIYILYGPPTEKREDPDADTQALPASGRGLIRWIYEGRPGGRKDLDAIVVVPFVRDASGEYRVSHDPKLASVFFDWLSVNDPVQPWERWIQQNLPLRQSELGVMLDLGKLQEVPPHELVLLERVETVESYGAFPLGVQVSRYRHPGFGGTLVVLTADLAQTNAARVPALIARFTARDATIRPRILGEGSFRIEGKGQDRTAQGRLVLGAGTWDLTVLAADSETGGTGIYRGAVVVPEPSDRLRFSDVDLVKDLEPLQYASLASYDEPFVVGTFRVVPRVGRVVPRGEPLRVFYEMYGGSPPYRITYRLEGQENDGSWVSLGRPAVLEQAEGPQGWELPTGESWPLGEYRIQIVLQDARGATVTALAPFTLVDPEAS